MIKLSIITINLNNASGLEKTIKSVLSQSYANYEFIIIDGGSVDESLGVISRYRLNCMKVVSEPDKGIYNAMNKGIKLACGEYVQFLNSGDYLVNDHVLSDMFNHIDNASIFIGNLLKVLPSGRIYRDKGNVDNISFYTFYKYTLNHASAFIKKSLFDKYGMYDESLKIVSDWKFYLIVVGLHEETVIYRNIDVVYFDMTGVSNSNIALLEKERNDVLKSILPYNIHQDYIQNGLVIELFSRIKKNRMTMLILGLVTKFIFQIDKLKYKLSLFSNK